MTDSARDPLLSPQLVGGVLLGTALVAYGRRRRGTFGLLSSHCGAGLIGGVLARPTARQIVRAGAARRRVRVHRRILVQRPVHEVFSFCHEFENFPQIIGSLRSVTDHQDGRSHWEVTTPSGQIIGWDAVVTKYVPNAVIGWASVPGGKVDSTGLVRFAPTNDGCTSIEIDLTYAPRDTTFRDAVHALVDVSREAQVESDLARVDFFFRSLPAEEPEAEAETETTGPGVRNEGPAAIEHIE
jgi:uncharacterized membrane protein